MAETIFMIRSGIFRLILSFLHLVYSGLEYFDKAWALFKRKLDNMFMCTDSQLYVSNFATRLKKCPNHFAVITGDEIINFEDFSNLVVWCIAAGISFISFYDYTGYLKDNEGLYFNYLMSKRKLDPNYVVFNEKRNKIKNGFKKNGFKKSVHVNVLSREDGKILFSKLVGNVCEKALYDYVKFEEINERYIADEIYEIVGFTEPELAIVSGKVCSTYGFLPWHIRLTEFLQVPCIKNLTAQDFTSILMRYSSCNQRFGS